MESTKSIPKLYPSRSLHVDTRLVSTQTPMDNDRPRSIRFPQWLWDEIDRDAERCNRSAVKQMETVLTAYYRGDQTALNTTRLDEMGGKKKGMLATEIELKGTGRKRKLG